jgi:hypothetical protein
MTEVFKQTPLATAVKRVTFCAATTALLATTSMAQAVEVKFGGYVKADAIYDLDQDLGASLAASAVAVPSTSSNENFRIHALQSRFNITATEGDVKVFVEGDFFGGQGNEVVSNSAHFRLRHAYGQMGNMLAGQTWSTFMDKNWVLYPTTVDFGGPAGATFVRQSQFRWNINDNLDFALENPENRVDEGGTSRGRDSLPDVILRYARTGDISWQIAGLFQQFEVDTGAAAGESESNFGVTGGVNFKTGSGSVSIKANANSNRYTYYGFDNPAAVVVGSSIETIDHTAVVAAYNHDWGGPSNAKTTIAFGSVDFDDEFLALAPVSAAGGISETIETFHINYRWSPATNVNLGVEVSNASREILGGGDADNTRLQFGAQYTF